MQSSQGHSKMTQNDTFFFSFKKLFTRIGYHNIRKNIHNSHFMPTLILHKHADDKINKMFIQVLLIVSFVWCQVLFLCHPTMCLQSLARIFIVVYQAKCSLFSGF